LAIHRLGLEELMLTIPDPFDRVTLALKIVGFPESEIARMPNLPRNSRKVHDRLRRIGWRARRNGEGARRGGLLYLRATAGRAAAPTPLTFGNGNRQQRQR
jgi:hypothetical protein